MTPFTKVYSMASVVITDYKITSLMQRDVLSYYEYMRSLLMRGKNLFTDCLQSLEYTSQTETIDSEDVLVWYFTSDLTDSEIGILALTIEICWYEQQVQDVVVFKGKIPSRDFKDMNTYVKETHERIDKKYEQFSRNKELYFQEKDNFNQLEFFGGV